MTDGPRTPSPQAPDTAPGAPQTTTDRDPGVAPVGEGFEGSMVLETPNDGEESSVVPQEPLPDNATETEKDLAEDNDK